MNANASLTGVAGVVGLTNDPIRGHVLTVDGHHVKRDKGEYLLPGADGATVRARLQGRFFHEHPIITIAGKDYTTGGATPPFLLVIAFLPVLFLFTGSPVSALLAVLGVLFNLWIVRAARGEAWKAAVILVVFVALVVFTTFWAFFSSWVVSMFRR